MELHNPFALTGKTILVTGASSGIGRSIAVEAAGIGATVIVTARNEERLKETFEALAGKERGHRMIVADLLDVEQMENMVNSISQLDGLVLCAGKGLTLPLQFATREKFDDIFNVNFFAPVELLRLLFKKKKAGERFVGGDFGIFGRYSDI